MDQLSNNKQYKDLPTDNIDRIQTNSKPFFNMFIQSNETLSKINNEAVKPLLEFLRMVRKQHEQQGVSIRDTTLLTLSFKSSLTDYLKHTTPDGAIFKQLNQLIDTFGILSFELYSNEQK